MKKTLIAVTLMMVTGLGFLAFSSRADEPAAKSALTAEEVVSSVSITDTIQAEIDAFLSEIDDTTGAYRIK